MNSIVGDRYIAELVQIFEQQGSALYTGQHSLCLTVPCLHYINKKIAAVREAAGSPLPTQFAHLEQLEESFGRIMVLKLIADRHYQLSPTTTLSLEPFKSVHSLILKKIPLTMITGLSRLRSQIRSLVIQRCEVQSMEEIIVKCGGDDSASFSWASLRDVDFSQNTIGQLGESLQFLTAIEKVDLSNNAITDDSTGIEFIDGVTYLHLGFNQLKLVPRLGPRAKFSLTALNLRNNQLTTIEGLQELDSLTDLDLTDNLLARHSDLKPLQNLHNLCLLSLIGNPLSFHPKHRLKAVEALSNLINPLSFRFDGKKLSSNEKKAIPRTLTHYPGSSPSLSSNTTSDSPLHNHHTLTPPPSAQLMSGNSPGHHSDAIVASKRRHRKKPPTTRVVTLQDSDEDQDSLNDTGSGAATDTASSVPLKYERRLQKMKDLAKQMPDKWLLSNASLDTTSSESNQMARGASQPRTAQEQRPLDPASMDTVLKASGGSESQSNGVGKKKKKRKSADAAVVEPRTSTPIMISETDGVSGECFLVERYESDVEEGDEEGEHILLTLSDRFLEEKDTNGVTLDRMDLACLMTAEVQRKTWKSAQQLEVVTLQFSHERRDRRKREYVMIEENHDAIIDILAPILEDNRKAFSLASKVECFTCQRVFDATESKLMPLLKDTQRSPPTQPHSLSGHQRTSLANRFCPFCKSQQLQYISNSHPFNKPLTALSKSASPRGEVPGEHGVVDSTGQSTDGNVKSGFAVSSNDASNDPIPNAKSREHSSPSIQEPVTTGEWESLENAYSYDKVTSNPHNDSHDHQKSSEHLAPLERDQQYTISSWSFGELSGNQETPRNVRSSHDVLYHADNRDDGGTENARYDARYIDNSHTQDAGKSKRGTTDTVNSPAKHKYNTFHSRRQRGGGGVSDLSQSGGKSRLTHSEPTPRLRTYVDAGPGNEVSSQQSKDFRWCSSTEQPEFKQRNPIDERVMHNRFSADSAPSLSRMKLRQGSLGSVQEQPVSKSLNPFDDVSCSTNPFDEDLSMEEDEQAVGAKERRERKGDGDDSWNQSTPQARGSSFSQNEERYFTHIKSHSKEEGDEDRPDLHIPVRRDLHRVPASSSVPATSYMTALAGHTKFSNFSRDHMRQNKSSTLPHSKSPRNKQESPELSSKRSATLPRGKPPLYGAGMVRGKSMESLDRSSPKNEQHPTKSNRISPSSQKRGENPDYTSRYSVGRERGPRLNTDSTKPPRNSSASPPVNTGSSGSGKSTPESIRRGHSSSDTQSTGSRRKLTRVTSVGDIRSAGEKGCGSSSGEKNRHRSLERGRGRSSADESQTSSRSSPRESGGGSSSGGGGKIKLSMSGGSSGGIDGHQPRKLSSSESSSRPLSTSVLIKDEDPSYIHNNFNLHLDMHVFNTERGEHFKMIFKAPMVSYKSAKEVPTLVVFSNLNTFIYRITAPQSSQPDKWLSLQHTLPLSKLVYLDVGPFHQFLRLEYSIAGACLTFLLRDKDKCRECLTRLSLIVSDCPRSSFKGVGIFSFHLEHISHPDRALRGAIMAHYDNIKTSKPQRPREEGRSGESCEVKFYMLAYRLVHTPGKKHSKIPVTVVVADNIIYIGQENLHQWPLPRLQELPPKESLEPPFSSVEQKDVTDIEQITIDPDQTCQVVVRFFNESVTEGDSKYWRLTTELESHVQQLVKAIQTPWENMFKIPLPINYK